MGVGGLRILGLGGGERGGEGGQPPHVPLTVAAVGHSR